MGEELLQRNLLKNPPKIGKWNFYNIGSTSLNELKESGIIPQKDYKAFGKRKPDGIITSKQKVIAVIENKSISKFKTDIQKQGALKQGIDVANILNAKILILTDTIETVWINCSTGNKIQDEAGNEFKYVFNASDEKLPEMLDKIIISINEQNDQIKPKNLVNPTDLAKQIWQDIWSVSGATPENCLYTFVELFIFKYLSDLGVLHGVFSFYSLLKNYSDNNKEEILEYYAGTIRPKIKELFKENPIDKTTIINGTIFVSKDQRAVKGYSSVFKKILDKFDKYGKLEYIDRDFKSQLFESFLKESISKKNWGQFFTPLKVVRAMVKMAESDITKGKIICDPACGVGKFLLEAVIPRLNYFYEVKRGEIESHITICGFDKGFDKDEQKTIILAKANMLIYFSDLVKENPGITNKFSDLFNKTFELKTNSILGTLSEPVKEKYDIILTNPPYVTSGSSNLKDEISKDETILKPYYKINAMGVEGLFMEWIIRALKPGGKAFIVVPDGIFNRQNDRNLRQFILNECIIDGIISLPLKTFFTTQKKTYILCMTKKDSNTETQTTPVFTYLVNEIGESRDIYRFPIEEDDLSEAIIYFNQFKNAKTAFKTNDPRCKIQSIEKFVPESYWNIERWWGKDEQISLGIAEEEVSIKIEEFPELIEEVANNVLAFKEEILLLNEKKPRQSDFDDSSEYQYNDVLIKEVFIGDIFDFPSTNSKITKEFCNNNKGNIPVYASSKDEKSVLGYIKDNMPNIKYYEDCLSWNRNGSVGYVFIRNHKFTTNEDHRAFVVKKQFAKNLSKDYLKFTIESNLLKGGFSFLNKCGLDKIKKVKIPIPVTQNGEFNLSAQKKIAQKYQQIKQTKMSILKELNRIEATVIDFL
jgi:type I restriction-modification system DNA methylase subunit